MVCEKRRSVAWGGSSMQSSDVASASAAGLIVFLLIWEAIARSGFVASTLLPAPSVLPRALISEVSLGFWHAMVLASMEHYLIGLFLGSLLGIACGMAVALFTTLVGAVFNLWLTINAQILIGGAARLADGVIAQGEADARARSDQ